MSVTKLIKEFAVRPGVPVPLEDVVSYLKRRGVTDEIFYFWDTDLDPSLLSGLILQEAIPINDQGDFEIHSTITYAKMGEEMERLVCCKELLHLLDPEDFQVAVLDDFNALVEKIILPPDLVDPLSENKHSVNDRVAITKACAVLFPLAARDILVPLHAADKLTLRQIADLVSLPLRYVSIVMSEFWPQIHNILTRDGD